MTLTKEEIEKISMIVGRPKGRERPAYLVDWQIVDGMREAGFSWKQISQYIGMPASTLTTRQRRRKTHEKTRRKEVIA